MKPGHMRGECPELQKKYKKDKVKRAKAMIATWSDEESDFSSGSKNQVANIYLMVHDGDSFEVNFELNSITIEQWEELYENLYTKYKKLKHKNESIKVNITAEDNLENQLKNVECITTENDSLKSKNEYLSNKIALFDLDVIFPFHKLSQSNFQIINFLH